MIIGATFETNEQNIFGNVFHWIALHFIRHNTKQGWIHLRKIYQLDQGLDRLTARGRTVLCKHNAPWYACLQEYHYDIINIILYVFTIGFLTLAKDVLIPLGYVNAYDITNTYP
jgi:hypothetical protein